MNHAFEEHFIGYILKFLFFPNKRPLYVYNQKISFNPTVVSIARLDSVFSGKFTGNKHIHNERSGTSGLSLFERLCQFVFQDLNHFVYLVGFCNLEVVLHRHPVNAQPAISLNGEKSEVI